MDWQTDGPRQRAGLGLLLGLLAGLLPLVLAWRHPLDALAPGWAVPFHTLVEAAFVAEAAALFGIGWFATGAPHRLRPMLMASFCAPMALLDLLHLVTYPGMPSFLGVNGPEVSFYFGRLARLALPLALLAFLYTNAKSEAPAHLRHEILAAMAAGLLLLAWLPLAQPQLLPTVQGPNGNTTLFKNATQWGLIGLDAWAAFVCWLRYRRGYPPGRHLGTAAILAAMSELCFIGARGVVSDLNVLGHLYGDLALALMFLALHEDGIQRPWRALEGATNDARKEKERADAILRAIVDGVIVVDHQLTVTDINPVASHIVGIGAQKARNLELGSALGHIGMAAEGLIIRDVTASLRHGLARRVHDNPLVYVRSGTAYAIEHAVSPITDRHGHVNGVVLVLRDVTDRWRLQQQLRDSADYVRNLFDSSADLMMAVSCDGIVMDLNQATERITGRSRQALIGSDFAAIFSMPDDAHAALQRVFPAETVRDLSLIVRGSHGAQTEVLCNFTPCHDASGSLWGAFVVAHDVTDLRTYQSYLEYQATSDALTSLPNRRRFRERIEQALVKSQRTQLMGAVMFIDLDNFKDVNDTLGHAAGDDLLKRIALRLTDSLRETDTVARIGGDEFAILAEDIAVASDVHGLAEKLLHIVTQPLTIDGTEIIVSCSIGISIFPLDPGNADALLRNADTAMYRAKEDGKNNFQYFTSEMNRAVQRRVELGNRLRNAIQHGELAVVFQPRVDLATNAIVGAEALLRWTSPELGPVSPMEFIPIAENTGLILPIGEWVLRAACREARRWQLETGRAVAVAVNLSARQLHNNDIVQTVLRILDETGLPAHLLELELTESMLMRDTSRVIETLTRLKQTGLRIAIDDFGTGYSSLSYLKRFPIDHLKIDRSFVTDIPGDSNDEAITRTIIALARGLGLRVVAEGVETATQLAFLRDHGCDEVQGYYISRPVPVDELIDQFLRPAATGAISLPTP